MEDERLMRKDITYIYGVELEETVEITRHCFFRDEEMLLQERIVHNQEEFKKVYFDMLNYWKFERCIAELHEKTGKETFFYYGNCEVCNSPQPFIVDYHSAGMENGRKMINWRERLVCPNCGCNNRERIMAHKIYSEYESGMNVLLYEEDTNLYNKILREIPTLKGVSSKDQKGPNWHWFEHLEYMDNEFKLMVSNDVFQTAQDYKSAFEEAYRVLDNGGKLFFSVPFNGNSDATEYRDGIYIFGWDLIDVLNKIGFSDAYGMVYYGLKDGYLGYLPLYFEACK